MPCAVYSRGKGLTAVGEMAAYCRVRLRLPVQLPITAFRNLTAAVARETGDFGAISGPLLVLDGITVIIPDSDANRAVCYTPAQHELSF